VLRHQVGQVLGRALDLARALSPAQLALQGRGWLPDFSSFFVALSFRTNPSIKMGGTGRFSSYNIPKWGNILQKYFNIPNG
jgi:hypothetical protein